jgi:L-rhamnose isomerase
VSSNWQLETGFASRHADLRRTGRYRHVFVEYRLFEPAFYAIAIVDWGRADTLCAKLGDQAKMLVDLEHNELWSLGL